MQRGPPAPFGQEGHRIIKLNIGNLAPFGFDAARIFEVAPTVAVSGGVGQIEYLDVNTATALAKLNQNVQYDTIDRYVSEGMNPLVLGTIFVSHVEVHKDLMEAMVLQAQKKCTGAKAQENPTCRERTKLAEMCKSHWPEEKPVRLEGGNEFFFIANHARTKCEYLKFQYFITFLRLSEYGSDLITETSAEKLKTAEGKLFAVPKSSSSQGIRFQADGVNSELSRLQKALKRHKNRLPLKFTLRSPKSLLSYLGELIALQTFADDTYVPDVMLGSGERIVLFKVFRNSLAVPKAVLAIRGPDEKVYSVARPEYGSPTRDQTLRILAIAGEVVNGAISEKDFPAPASVVVRAIQ